MESFETKNNIIGAHGMLPILEVLETCKKREVVLKLLRIVNAVSIYILSQILMTNIFSDYVRRR